jgi:hypothetical protein
MSENSEDSFVFKSDEKREILKITSNGEFFIRGVKVPQDENEGKAVCRALKHFLRAALQDPISESLTSTIRLLNINLNSDHFKLVSTGIRTHVEFMGHEVWNSDIVLSENEILPHIVHKTKEIMGTIRGLEVEKVLDVIK